MIVISHAQARRLITDALDERRVPPEQWSALQAHLEACAECRAFRERMLAQEKTLRRDLRGRWAGAQAPGWAGMARRVITFRQRRSLRRHIARRAAVYLLAFALVAGFVLYRRTQTPPAARANPPAAARITPTVLSGPAATQTYLANHPTSEFQGVVAYSAPGVGGSPDIYLLRQTPSGGEVDNLTQNPASDTDPAWSPDGQWLAFISNRDGTAQIYLVSVAGTRLTRLTGDPNTAWSGPLSWSADGRWIAATGTTKDSTAGWLYRVAWDGSPPERIPGAKGGRFARFAPTGSRLAYQVASDGASMGQADLWDLRVYDESSGSTLVLAPSSPSPTAAPGLVMPSTATPLARSAQNVAGTPTPFTEMPFTVSPGAYDWSADGRGIVYLASLPDGITQIRAVRNLDLLLPVTAPSLAPGQAGLLGEDLYNALPGAALFAGWSVDNELLYGQAAAGSGTCAQLSAFLPGSGPGSSSLQATAPPAPTFPPLCLTAGFDRANWSADGRWLVVAARQGSGVPGIYAVNLPDQAESSRMATADRLGDLPQNAGPLAVRPDRPAQEPSLPGPVSPIDPRQGPTGRAQPAAPPGDLLSRVVLARFSQDGSTLARLDSSGEQAALPSGQLGFCPRSAPAAAQTPGRTAFVAYRNTAQPNRSDLFVMDSDGQRIAQITRAQDFPTAGTGQRLSEQARYACPVWSPDGGALAAWVETETRRFLAILPVPAEGAPGTDPPARGPARQARYIPMRPSSAPPLWSPDGTEVLAASLDSSGQPQIVRYDAASGQPEGSLRLDGWDTVLGMDFARGATTGGERQPPLAFVIGRVTSTGGWMIDLRVVNIWDGETLQAASLPGSEAADPGLGYSGLTWLNRPGEQWLGLVYRASLTGRARSALLLYDLTGRKLRVLIATGASFQAAAWSPDGSWVIYTTPGGLYALNIPAALAGDTAPTLLSDETATDLDWK